MPPLRRALGTAKSKKKWSQAVTGNSNIVDLERGAFTSDDPREIADSLKHSVESSKRRKAGAFRSAMSILNFYFDRTGNQLTKTQNGTLEKAKDELREDFGRETRHSGHHEGK